MVSFFPNTSKDRGTGKSVESYREWETQKNILTKVKEKIAYNRASKYTENISSNKENGFEINGVKQGKQMSIEKADKGNSNPLYVTNKAEYTKNCQRCVWTYELRRRGYDVIANNAILDGTDTLAYMRRADGWANVAKDGVENLISMASAKGIGCKKNIEKQMQSFGDGARAIIRVQWQNYPCGHVFIAEQANGATQFIDPQTGDLNASKYFETGMIKPQKTYLLRTDDKEITDLINKCAKGKGK